MIRKGYIYLACCFIIIVVGVLALLYYDTDTMPVQEDSYLGKLEQFRENEKELKEKYTLLKKQHYQDSVLFITRLRDTQNNYTKLKTEYEKIDYSTYCNNELDSVIKRLYPD